MIHFELFLHAIQDHYLLVVLRGEFNLNDFLLKQWNMIQKLGLLAIEIFHLIVIHFMMILLFIIEHLRSTIFPDFFILVFDQINTIVLQIISKTIRL